MVQFTFLLCQREDVLEGKEKEKGQGKRRIRTIRGSYKVGNSERAPQGSFKVGNSERTPRGNIKVEYSVRTPLGNLNVEYSGRTPQSTNIILVNGSVELSRRLCCGMVGNGYMRRQGSIREDSLKAV